MKPEAKQQTASGFLLSMEDMLNIEESVFALKERIKELSCLYRIAELASMPNLDPGELLQRAVEMIPPAMQYPEVACAHLMVREIGRAHV